MFDPLNIKHLPHNSEIQVFLQDGTSFLGVFKQSAGWPWVSVQGQEPFSLSHGSPEFARVTSISVLPTTKPATQMTRALGEIAYVQPTTRQEYRDTLWRLAAHVRLTQKQTNIDQPEYSAKILRCMQLENQFHALADQIALAKTKRRYIFFCALRRTRGEPLPNPLDLMGSPLDARALQVPKESDFHPDPKVRKRRSLSPSIAYPTLAEVNASLRDAQYNLAKRGTSQKKRATFKRIVAKRQKQIQTGLYREAIERLEKNATRAPIQNILPL
jgi:hypothetical protein